MVIGNNNRKIEIYLPHLLNAIIYKKTLIKKNICVRHKNLTHITKLKTSYNYALLTKRLMYLLASYLL